MLQRLFVHTAQVTLRTEGSVCLGSAGSGGGGGDKAKPRSCLTGTKTSREKGKYGLLHGMRVCRQQVQE